MRNPALEPLDALVGEWDLTLTDAWFLESRDVRQHGRATVRWLGDAFVELEAEMEGQQVWHFVLGRSDATDQLVALYHDPRPTSRLFRMTFAGGDWTLHREDPDFHQRFVATVAADRIQGRWDASEDDGATWRKDFDLVFERVVPPGASGRRTDTASRVMAASPEQVFASLVDREALAAWLPPEGMAATFEHFDPRPGGSYRLVLTYLDPSRTGGKATTDSDVVDARYLEIVPGDRVVQAVDFVSDDPAFAGTMTMTWKVTAVDEGTRVDLIAEDVPAGISAEDHAAGLASSLANLAAYLER